MLNQQIRQRCRELIKQRDHIRKVTCHKWRPRLKSALAFAICYKEKVSLKMNGSCWKRSAALIILLLCGATLRAFRLDFQSLWTDEIFTLLAASDEFWKIIVNPFDPDVPGLYYLIVHPLLLMSDQAWLLRLPSVVFGTFSIILLYLITKNWFGEATGILAAALITISPFHIWYSQEARAYALLLFLALLSLWLLQKAISSPHDLWSRCGFVLAAAASFYCHPVALAFIGFLGIYTLWQIPRQKWVSWLPLFGAVAVLMMPAILRMLMIPPTEADDPSRSSYSPIYIPYSLWTFATGYSLGPSLTELHLPNRMGTLVPYLYLIVPLILFFAAVFLHGVIRLQQKARAIFWINALWLAIPLAGAVFGAIISSHPFNVRYAILSFPPFLILLAVGALNLPRRWMRASVVSALLLGSLVSLHNYYYDERYHREDNRAAGRFLAAHAAPGDLVIACADYTLMNIRHYSRRSDLRIVGYTARSELETVSNNEAANGSHEIASVALVSAPSVSPSSSSSSADFLVTDDLRRIVGDRPRVWLFLSRTYHGDPKGDLRRFFNEHFRAGLRFQGTGVEVISYEQNTQ